MDLYIYPPTPISVAVPPIEFENGSGTPTTVSPTNRLPVDGALTPADFPDNKAGQVEGLIEVSPTFPIDNTTPREIVASLAEEVQKLEINDTIGQFYAVMVGELASEEIACYVGPGGGNREVSIPAGERVSLKSMTGSPIETNGNISINFLG